jgi:SAM-dependent methyltransferase
VDATDIRATTSVEDRHWWYRERRAIIERELRSLGGPGRAIEIGAAGGGNLAVAKRLGWDVVATEYIGAGAQIARSRGLPAVQADARCLPVTSAAFNLVIIFDVLEHIEDDRQAAAELCRVLKPGGTALIAVPCDMALWSAHDVASGHVRRYTRETLTDVVTGAGLVVDTLWSWNVLLRPAVKLRRRSATEDRCCEDITAVHPVVNAALGAVVKVERYLPVRSLPGVSLMMRAHRPA